MLNHSKEDGQSREKMREQICASSEGIQVCSLTEYTGEKEYTSVFLFYHAKSIARVKGYVEIQSLTFNLLNSRSPNPNTPLWTIHYFFSL